MACRRVGVSACEEVGVCRSLSCVYGGAGEQRIGRRRGLSPRWQVRQHWAKDGLQRERGRRPARNGNRGFAGPHQERGGNVRYSDVVM
ncbi:hypothetical protein HBI56_132130 [Parastagonospora nodorum]|uniref:Uncharacterized protein n=1 Tax=Phaeosphaeria nodorum (strain SN15 / ATCC MYA-4574 / FGSC 10173) TaxID=321614 RepID=A0A7U2HZ97_PHANO|nr:hypothetical protein HBH56_151700 [Parastagonospora nodorum]QRC96148.1 hypothetical protein JI435_408330 [Parastagonospora nodorum SN15]KAH3926702.1 hypothetical protein HBH54_166000 [Parastagonospora nodorum]KAH3971910.1 hypothetical protein HBH51_108310 [Parastagonospora nodorum]KAH3996922.1 hypothetical protein HBI10_154050 [Parastagonospora nodorum]